MFLINTYVDETHTDRYTCKSLMNMGQIMPAGLFAGGHNYKLF